MIGEPAELLASYRPSEIRVDAYERLLGEAMRGDATLFAREDYVEAAWKIVDPILGNVTPIADYEPKTWGPGNMDKFLCPPAAGAIRKSESNLEFVTWKTVAAPAVNRALT